MDYNLSQEQIEKLIAMQKQQATNFKVPALTLKVPAFVQECDKYKSLQERITSLEEENAELRNEIQQMCNDHHEICKELIDRNAELCNEIKGLKLQMLNCDAELARLYTENEKLSVDSQQTLYTFDHIIGICQMMGLDDEKVSEITSAFLETAKGSGVISRDDMCKIFNQFKSISYKWNIDKFSISSIISNFDSLNS